jgi:hypothetical protein
MYTDRWVLLSDSSAGMKPDRLSLKRGEALGVTVRVVALWRWALAVGLSLSSHEGRRPEVGNPIGPLLPGAYDRCAPASDGRSR